MGLRNLFRRKSKTPKEAVATTKRASKENVMEEDKLPSDTVMPEKASVQPTEAPIEEERDDTTLETDDEMPTPEVETEKAAEEVKSSEKSNKFACCEPEVFQNLQAAVGLVSS